MMTTLFTESTKTGTIVTKFPAASKIFQQYKIDFCCGGNRPIGEVLKEMQLDQEDILTAINDLYIQQNQTDVIDWMRVPLSGVVTQIIDKYHQYTREVLEELSIYVTKVTRVHGERDSHLKDVYQNFFLLKEELEQHLLEEEKKIFPAVLEYEKTGSQDELAKAKAEIAHLEEEHDAAGELLRKIRKVTSDYTLPENACNTYTLTYLKLEELESMTFQHIHLENNVLFQRI